MWYAVPRLALMKSETDLKSATMTKKINLFFFRFQKYVN